MSLCDRGIDHTAITAGLKESYLKTAALQACVEKQIQPFLSAMNESDLPIYVVRR
ncbi:MAG: hypothetical protein MUP70_08200 [Candidatus Aminicenantes bacterium]|nr:hypothetical protein [Candidatus Aminicenantes bacterium]